MHNHKESTTKVLLESNVRFILALVTALRSRTANHETLFKDRETR